MDINTYDAQADTIDVDDITTNSNNRIVLRRIKRNDANDEDNECLSIQNVHYSVGGDYVPEGADDMGWLGYFVGKNEHLKRLHICPWFTPTSSGSSVRDMLVPFFRGVNLNKSIREIGFYQIDLLGGETFTMLGPFFKNNHNLTNITIRGCDLVDEGCRLFALAIGSSTNKSLKRVALENTDISDEGMVDILTALSMHPQLKYLDLEENRLSTNGCVALATLLRCTAKELQHLFLSDNDIGDEGIEALVPALTTCYDLQRLRIGENPSITTRGWQRFASILEPSNSNLEELYIGQNNIDDEAAAAFANALTNNHTLETLELGNNPLITAVGWQAFSKILRDTSSVNATFLSNHTLLSLGDDAYGHLPLLELNERDDKKEVATIKILQCHDDFDMQPFFEWEFKVLPLVISWLEKASECEMPENFEPNIERRKLSTIYQFVRDMPVLYVETRLRKELEDIKARAKQMQEEQRMLEERKMSIMRRLGRL